jgi:ATP-dependent DNA helicase RecQ
MDIHDTLKTTFGFGGFLPGQDEVISRILGGRSVLAVFLTGQGKSLCYQLSGLHLPGLTLVVSPLMALMKDQIDFLLARRIAAARLDSSLSREEFAGVNADLGRNRLNSCMWHRNGSPTTNGGAATTAAGHLDRTA